MKQTPNITLGEAVRKFLEYAEITKRQSAKTLENYQHYLGRLLHFAGEGLPIARLDNDLVYNYRLHLNRLTTAQGNPLLTAKTQQYHLIALRAFLKFMARHDYVTLSPDKIELGKLPDRTVDFLERDELEALFNVVDKSTIIGLRDYAILRTLYSTGLRISELVSLNKADVNLDTREFRVMGKGNKYRIVFLSSDAVAAIDNYWRERHDDWKAAFINHGRTSRLADGNDRKSLEERHRLSPTMVQYLIRNYARQAGLIKKVTPHKLRHSFATEMLRNGADLRSVQEMLGHSSITTTQIYTHVTNRHLHDMHNKFHK